MKKKTRFLSVVLAVLLLLSAVPFTASALTPSYLAHFEGNVGEDGAILEFEPTASGWYSFTSQSMGDTYGSLYDEEGYEIAYVDDNYYDWDFCLKANLQAGKTYTLEIGTYEDEDLWVEVFVEETVAAVRADLVSLPDDVTVLEENIHDSVSLDGLEIDFTLSDGSVVHWDYITNDRIEDCDVEWDVYYDENDEILVDDGKVYIWVGLDEAYVELEFELIENNVESIEINGETLVLFEDVDGEYDEDYGYFYYYYGFTPNTTITVNYKDGTSVTKGVNESIDGFWVDSYSNQYEQHWTVGGENNYFYATYRGAETKVPVEIVESPVESLTVTKSPDVTEYDGPYYPLWEGTEVTITLKDGKKIVHTIEEEELSCYSFYQEWILDVEDYVVTISFNYDWDKELEYYVFSCHGKEDVFSDFSFKYTKDAYELNVIKMTETGEDAVVEVLYDTGEKETFNFDVVDYYNDYYFTGENDDEYVEYLAGFTKTEHGYADYELESVYDEEGTLIGYDFFFLGAYTYIDADMVESTPDYSDPFFIGDADMSGTVNIKDATAIQKHTAGIITLEEVGESLADVDNNGNVNVKDATAIQKWLAGIETGCPIGHRIN